MSFGDYPDEGYFIELRNGLTDIGAFQLGKDLELQYIQLTMLNFSGDDAGLTGFRLYVSVDASGRSSGEGSGEFVAESNLVTWSDVEDLGEYWLGFVRFDFDREHLDKDITYRLTIQSSTYAPNASRWVGVKVDWPDTVNDTPNGPQLRIFGYREL